MTHDSTASGTDPGSVVQDLKMTRQLVSLLSQHQGGPLIATDVATDVGSLHQPLHALHFDLGNPVLIIMEGCQKGLLHVLNRPAPFCTASFYQRTYLVLAQHHQMI